MKQILTGAVWFIVVLLGAGAYATLAFKRGEPINSGYILVAALCTYAVGYRFYSKWIAARILALDDRRATPCEVHDDGKDFVKTNKWIVFGHHFAAISGPGPLVGPVLAAQFGYLPGTLWILIGVVLGGAVQDFVILFASMRRDGKSLAQMVRDELNTAAGVIGVIAILSIMVILLAVLALVVVNALADSPWGVFTVAATIPIALFLGGYLRWIRAGKVLEGSLIGVALLLLAVWGGSFVSEHATLKTMFKWSAPTLAWSVIGYAFAASVLPVWLLLAPRDYLSTFMKLGTIFLLALGVLVVLPKLQMPALTQFIDGSGPVVPGKLFPFCFITIACGAISGFHTLISRGITPKIITRESYARPVGYGAMCLESLVAIMAMIAACTLDPGVYLAMNIKGSPAQVVTTVNSLGMTAITSAEIDYSDSKGSSGHNITVPVDELAATQRRLNLVGSNVFWVTFKEGPVTVSQERMAQLASEVKEETLYGRTGGAATLAVGMANLFSKVVGQKWLGIWYHFALMFEALFILTTLDAGTRVGRYLLQDALGHVWKPLGNVRSLTANLFASALVVGAWGYFLVAAVYDPDGGIKALWPIFGIANQLLAATALCLATTVILKMSLGAPASSTARGTDAPLRSPAFALVTLIPLLWLLAVTGTAAVQKIWHPDPKIGFLAGARAERDKFSTMVTDAKSTDDSAKVDAFTKQLPTLQRKCDRQMFNLRLDAAVTAFFLALVAGIVLLSLREWILLLARRKLAVLRETAPTWLPDYAVTESKPLNVFSMIALALALAKELSGEAAMERARVASNACLCAAKCVNQDPIRIDLLGGGRIKPECSSDAELYVRVSEARFDGIRRCC
ncbi:MAG: carbon starvation protein A [Verrucomicrobia bacterium]|nr:carbon starvation protein A [Verrucomicrobiota bacterium]